MLFPCRPFSPPSLELGDYHNILRMLKPQIISMSACRQRFSDVHKLKTTLEALRNQKDTGIHTLYYRRIESEVSFNLRILIIEGMPDQPEISRLNLCHEKLEKHNWVFFSYMLINYTGSQQKSVDKIPLEQSDFQRTTVSVHE